jgi:hypothetical protein
LNVFASLPDTSKSAQCQFLLHIIPSLICSRWVSTPFVLFGVSIALFSGTKVPIVSTGTASEKITPKQQNYRRLFLRMLRALQLSSSSLRLSVPVCRRTFTFTSTIMSEITHPTIKGKPQFLPFSPSPRRV